jgi:hypothetical protein
MECKLKGLAIVACVCEPVYRMQRRVLYLRQSQFAANHRWREAVVVRSAGNWSPGSHQRMSENSGAAACVVKRRCPHA